MPALISVLCRDKVAYLASMPDMTDLESDYSIFYGLCYMHDVAQLGVRVIKHSRKLFAIPLLLLIVGCVSIDFRASREPIDSAATRAISGKFSNIASYRSTGQFAGDQNLCEIISYSAEDTNYVEASINNDGALVFECVFKAGEVRTRVFDPEDGLAYDPNGAIILKKQGEFVSGEGAFGYQAKKVLIFINSTGDLAITDSGGGAGFFGPFPFGIYAKNLFIFPRIKTLRIKGDNFEQSIQVNPALLRDLIQTEVIQ